jgi:hypothetical protein
MEVSDKMADGGEMSVDGGKVDDSTMTNRQMISSNNFYF